MTYLYALRPWSSQLGGVCDAQGAQYHMISYSSHTAFYWAGRTPNQGQPTGVPTLDLLECDFLHNQNQFIVPGSKTTAILWQTGWKPAWKPCGLPPVTATTSVYLVTSQSHTCAHFRERGPQAFISQLEERQGHIVKARCADWKIVTAILKMQSVTRCLWSAY